MKKNLLILCITLISSSISAQSYIGFLSDNYSGVHKVISNPADIFGSPYKVDLNLVGLSAFTGNNYYGVNVFDALKSGYSFGSEAKKFPSNENNALGNIDVLGPAVMFNLSPKSTIVFFSRGRFFGNINKIDIASLESLDSEITDDFNINEDNLSVLAHAWSEFGVTYSRAIIDRKHHAFNAGVSVKYLNGLASAYAVGSDFVINYDSDGTDFGGDESTGSINSSGNLTYARSSEFDEENYDYERPENTNGFGFDFGLTYIWKPDNSREHKVDSISFRNKMGYKLKIGLSVTDVGFIDYKAGIAEAFNINNLNVSEDNFDNSNSIGEFLNTFYTETDSSTGYIIDLPTAIHFSADYNFNDKFYLNLNTDFSLISKNRITANRVANVVSLTPRYESKWFSFYMPLSVIENNGFRVGAGFRAGPLYVGSGTLVSALTSDNNRGADVYGGLKVPLFEKGNKDRDGDGVINKLDNCPRVPGPVENNGCPWEDMDGDGVMDNLDKCPEEVGVEENNGCPWGDADQDGIKDNEDQCPEIFGLKQNKGCPFKDTDGDGIYDKDDVCIDEIGTKANNGCPEEVIKKLQSSLNEYAKVILFESGTSTLQSASKETLDKIVEVLNQYPSAKFTIEGHTDSIGTYEKNQILSEKRANAVKSYLIEKGIDSTRLSAIGFGEKKPIATNMYKHGRKQNRRVEINLVK